MDTEGNNEQLEETTAPEHESPVEGRPQEIPVADGHAGQKKRWSSTAVVIAATVGALVGGLLVAAALVWALDLGPKASTAAQNASTGATSVTINATSQSVDVAEAVSAKVILSVVNVTVMQNVTARGTGKTTLQEVGLGSGVIIRADGYILTNYHVVEGADQLIVKVGVDSKIATVVGTDPSSDLAVIKIEGTGYSAIEVGSSRDLKVGQWVMAVGSPFGLDRTVTSGIVSALQRSDIEQDQTAGTVTLYTNLIQTDAAINPGNSGGALVNDKGQLVGINSLIQSPSGTVGAAQSAGIGFAIPSDYAIAIANELITSGKATHPYLGISTQTVGQGTAPQGTTSVQSGAVVQSVAAGSPAEAAGIKVNDVITKIGDMQITGVADVFSAIRDHKIGDTVAIVLVRGGQTLTVNATLASDAAAK
ncbi:MAG: PDZ domain-containing protein [Coriobacteriia bacterium]|nr:PDZ domain-containing protein [Coriobacteriia bacterium]